MVDEFAIEVDGVYKNFTLPHERRQSLKSIFTSLNFGGKTKETQHVLRDVSFKVKKGDFFGIVGRNGSGKSTMLKILAGIYQPKRGKVKINGKLVPFIELGVGFNPELTGSENVYLNGAMMGFSSKEMDVMYKDIVEFAELHDFMDQKLKNYSSGMQVRLAFSVATRSQADILVLDEVLAVGDTNFQKKCNDYFEKIKHENKTVILVTHNMDAVERYCTKAALIDDGEIVKIGAPTEVTQAYSDLNFKVKSKQAKFGAATSSGDRSVSVTSQIMQGKAVVKVINARVPEKITIRMNLKSQKQIKDGFVGVIVYNNTDTPIFATNSKLHNIFVSLEPNEARVVDIEVDNIFSNGVYSAWVGLKSSDGSVIYAAERVHGFFEVVGRKHDFAITYPNHKIKIIK